MNILQQDASAEKAENARLSIFVGAIAIGDLVKTTLGPKGMDKILISGDGNNMQVTNDGATILKSVLVDNPAAKILCEISRVQDEEVGDGTTSVCVLAAELLRQAEKLIEQGIHPQLITQAFRTATQVARDALQASANSFQLETEPFRNALIQIANTTLSSKVLAQHKDHFSRLAVEAIERLKGSTELDRIQIIKRPGARLQDSFLADGFILDKKIGINQPKRLENAKILIANTPMDTDKVKVFGSKIKADSTGKLAEFERAEREKMREKIERIKAQGINCFINRQLIYNWPEQLFADAGIMAIEHADFDGIERLALVTGAEIASTFDEARSIRLGHCDLIEEVMIGEDVMIKFSGTFAQNAACTVVLRGATQQLLDEAERSLHDALCVLSQTVANPETVLGGGASEMLMASAIDRHVVESQLGMHDSGKFVLAMEAFAHALRELPVILANNGGYDGCDLVARLKREYQSPDAAGCTFGLNMANGTIGCMKEMGITESLKLKRQVLISASEAAEMILRVDQIVKCAPRKRDDHCHH